MNIRSIFVSTMPMHSWSVPLRTPVSVLCEPWETPKERPAPKPPKDAKLDRESRVAVLMEVSDATLFQTIRERLPHISEQRLRYEISKLCDAGLIARNIQRGAVQVYKITDRGRAAQRGITG